MIQKENLELYNVSELYSVMMDVYVVMTMTVISRLFFFNIYFLAFLLCFTDIVTSSKQAGQTLATVVACSARSRG